MKVFSSLLNEIRATLTERALSRKPRVQSKPPRRTKLADTDKCGDNGALWMANSMNESRGKLTAANNLMLVAFMLVSQAPSAAYSVLRVEPPPGFDALVYVGTLYIIGYWLEVDNRKYNFRWPYCRGILLHATSFFIIPYYLFKTRGRRAFLTLFIFVCLIISASLVGVLAAGFLVGSRFD